MQKIKALLIASIIFTGCTTTKEINCCDTESHQCDELYRDYNCHRTKTWSYDAYYPNTQTVYYYDFYGNRLQPNEYRSRDINGRPCVGDVTRPNAPSVTRPTNLGDFNRNKKPTSSKSNRN
jgi:hypothetical protein